MSKTLKNIIPYAFLTVILLNTLFSQSLLLKALGSNYTYVYTPFFWLTLAGIALYLLRKKTYRKKTKTDIIFWVSIAAAMYLILRFFLGIVEGFGKNALSTNFWYTLRNLFAYIVPYFCRETVRAALLKDCRTGKKRTKLLCVLSCIILAMSELNINKMLRSLTTPFGAFEQIGGYLMPALVESAMLTTTAIYAGPIPGIVYRGGTQTLFYILPVLPDNSWLTIALLGCLIPFVASIVINYVVSLSNHTMTRRDIKSDKPGGWIATFAVLIVFVLFITGVMPIYPVAVATGSMEPNIMTGDMVVVNKTDKAKNALEVGDVIQFQRGSITVIHRILEINKKDGELYFKTKGDNNNSPDSGEITKEEIIGRIEFRVPYLGWLTLWMHSQKVSEESEDIDVETGGHNPWIN